MDKEVLALGHNISFTSVHKNTPCTVCGMWLRMKMLNEATQDNNSETQYYTTESKTPRVVLTGLNTDHCC